MATITLNGTLQVSIGAAGGAVVGVATPAAINQVGTNSIGNVQNIGTTTEAIVLGDVTTIGYLMLINLDATNFVSVGLATPVTTGPGNAFAKLLPGEFCIIPTRQTVIYALADTAACDVFVVAIEL